MPQGFGLGSAYANRDHTSGSSSRDAAGDGRNPDRVVPPMLYLPVRELEDGNRIAEIRATEDGRAAILAYTALDRLADACGTEQPWAVIETVRLPEIQEAQPFDIVAFDQEIPPGLKRDGRLV